MLLNPGCRGLYRKKRSRVKTTGVVAVVGKVKQESLLVLALSPVSEQSKKIKKLVVEQHGQYHDLLLKVFSEWKCREI